MKKILLIAALVVGGLTFASAQTKSCCSKSNGASGCSKTTTSSASAGCHSTSGSAASTSTSTNTASSGNGSVSITTTTTTTNTTTDTKVISGATTGARSSTASEEATPANKEEDK